MYGRAYGKSRLLPLLAYALTEAGVRVKIVSPDSVKRPKTKNQLKAERRKARSKK